MYFCSKIIRCTCVVHRSTSILFGIFFIAISLPQIGPLEGSALVGWAWVVVVLETLSAVASGVADLAFAVVVAAVQKKIKM